MISKSKGNPYRWVLFVLVVWYVFLCLRHWLGARPLWNDEQCVFNSVSNFSAYQIFHEQLLNYQVFPRLYLFIIKSVSKIFDYHLLSLRLLSFLSMMGAFVIWLRIAKYEFKNQREYLAFVLCWPASVMLVYYSAELKQYSFDVLAASLVIWFLYNQSAMALRKSKWYVLILLGLPFLGLMSYPALLMMFLPAINLALSAWRQEGGSWKHLMLYAASMVVVVVLSYVFDMRLRDIPVVTDGFADYFISTSSPAEFFKTATEGVNNLFSRWIAESPRVLKGIARVFFAFGLFYMFYGFFKNIRLEKKLASVNTMALVIFMGLFLLGLMKKYPFVVPRTALFFCPVVMMMTIKGIGLLQGWNKYVYYFIFSAFIAFLVYVSLGIGNVLLHGYLNFASPIWR